MSSSDKKELQGLRKSFIFLFVIIGILFVLFYFYGDVFKSVVGDIYSTFFIGFASTALGGILSIRFRQSS